MIIKLKNVIPVCCLASLFKEEPYFLLSARKTRVKTKTLRLSGPRAAYCCPRNRSEAETNPSWARRPTSTYWWSLVSSWWVFVWGGAAWWQPKRSTANWWTPSSPSWLTVCLPSTSGSVFYFVDIVDNLNVIWYTYIKFVKLINTQLNEVSIHWVWT